MVTGARETSRLCAREPEAPCGEVPGPLMERSRARSGGLPGGPAPAPRGFIVAPHKRRRRRRGLVSFLSKSEATKGAAPQSQASQGRGVGSLLVSLEPLVIPPARPSRPGAAEPLTHTSDPGVRPTRHKPPGDLSLPVHSRRTIFSPANNRITTKKEAGVY
ncbi:hypothetical protein EYF80_042019 [Liparis tanakae]|uniref:Uncharacterized protein n=1 Tax=Liparis tanakae TaxID=230148 RepID=A0A4Z2G2I0_9TELE|nr:hypothetical protein EYF80_042019 [Liparis tanakae]